jgi:hypothetical protein
MQSTGPIVQSLCDWSHGILCNEPLAAWVQAVGTLVALFIAIYLPIRQDRKARRRKRQAMIAVAEAAYAHAKRIIDAIDASEVERLNRSLHLYEVFDQSIIDGDIKALRDVPLHELGSRDSVVAMRQLTDQMLFFGQATQKFMDGQNKAAGFIEAVKSTGTDELNQRPMLFDQQFSILAANARMRWREIDASFAVLKRTLE